MINPIHITHIIFSLVFAIGYCLIAEVFPKIKVWQGAMAGIVATIAVHWISFPLLGLTPSLIHIPFDEYFSELFGHIVWFWAIEIIRRDLRNRITHQPDPEVALNGIAR